MTLSYSKGFRGGSKLKNLPAMWETEKNKFDLWIRKIPWRRKWQRTPVFFPGKSHGQSLALYSPWGHKELDTTEYTHTHTHTHISSSKYCILHLQKEFIFIEIYLF